MNSANTQSASTSTYYVNSNAVYDSSGNTVDSVSMGNVSISAQALQASFPAESKSSSSSVSSSEALSWMLSSYDIDATNVTAQKNNASGLTLPSDDSEA